MTDDLASRPLRESELTPSSLDFPIVGMGASAGGLPALMTFFELMPPDCGMAFVVVLHLSPAHASNLGSLLQGVTKLVVQSPIEPVPLQPNHVYVIPPNKLLSMNDSYLRVTDLDRRRGRHVTIDLLFRSLAVVHKERAFAVVLSGNGSDGAVGVARVKEEGGVTIVQAPHEAEFDSMPRAAIATQAVDWVLPVQEMPHKLRHIWANARHIALPGTGEDEAPAAALTDTSRVAEDTLRDVLTVLRARTGHDFRNYKRATVLRRIERRMQVNGVPDLASYFGFLSAQHEEAQALLKDLLIGVTNFFRDGEAFGVLERTVLPQLLQQATDSPVGLRTWVAGCATGEEAYSVAMLLCEQAAQRPGAPKLQVFATDIDDSAIATARLGVYPVGIEADVSTARLRRFFDKEESHYRVRKEVREKVMFAAHNILRDPPFSRLDLVSCRNLLIYLHRDVHAEVLEMFHFALKPGGYLFLGSSESVDTPTPLFAVVDKKNRIFRANIVPRSPRFLPSLQLALPQHAVPLPEPSAEPRVERRPSSYAELHQRLAQHYAPPSVLVDEQGNIVHLSDRAGRFLRHGGGAPSHQLLNLVHPELRLELRTALFQAMQSGKSVEARRVRLADEARTRHVTMMVRPVHEPDSSTRLAMVIFAEAEESMGSPEGAAADAGRDPLVTQLEEELSRAKGQLQNTIEQSETSTEELKASNEELQAINEELRSTTEELETSKEELQSINEELITVNLELKGKVEETAKINDDLQNLIASTDIATVFVDRSMNIKRFTPHAMRLFNLIPGDVGRSLLDITHKLDYETLADDAAQAFQALRVIEREVRSDEDRWYLARVLPYRTTEDRIDGAVLTFVDITGRRRAEENLRRVAESTSDYAIVTADTEGRITTWNRAAERLFGHSEAQALGQPMEIIFTDEDRAGGVPAQELQRARDEGRAEDERWHQRKDGTRFYCSGVTTPLYDKGVLRGYGKIAREFSELQRRQAEQDALLRQQTAQRAEAQAASELKDEFLAVMSHELKNPLNLIQLNAELLMRLPEARGLPAVVRSAQTIRNTVLSQAQIIDDLLDLSRLNTGKLALHRAPVDWVGIVRTIAEAVQGEAAQKQVALNIELPVQPVMVDADPVRMEQVAWNLLSNALKFTPAGGRIDLRLWTEEGRAVLRVRDTGRGIAPQALPHVFDMFKQGEPGIARRHGGLGIGLALVRNLVNAHGGRVQAESDGLDQGACFTVQLPLQGGAALPEEPASDADATPWRGRRALVVDDDAEATETLRQLIELEAMQVVTARGGEEALALAQQQRFDLVVSDIAMPGMDGHELVKRLKALPSMHDVPMIAVSGMGRAVDARRALAAGFAAHLKKPITLDKLLHALRQMLND